MNPAETRQRAAMKIADEKLAKALGREPAVVIKPPEFQNGESFTIKATIIDDGDKPKIISQEVTRQADTIQVGMSDQGHDMIGLDPAKLLAGRLLIQGTSGAGKSWTIRRLLEQTQGELQQIVVDPEGEFRGLAYHCDHLWIDASTLDPSAVRSLARRVREHRLSLVLDISEQERERQMITVAALLEELVAAPREHWHPAIVAIDEAHLFAPFGGQASTSPAVRKAAIGAVVDLMTRGRKRGLAGILATQRLARLSKSVASEVHNFMIGLNTLDLDIRRAAETLGWDARRAFDRLPMLEPGDFVAVGPAFSRSPAVLRVGSVTTKHTGAAPVIDRPARVGAAHAAELVELEALQVASAADQEIRDSDQLVAGARAVREFMRDPAFPLLARVLAVLRPLAPEGARLTDLTGHLGSSREDLAAAIALLDHFGVVEFLGDGPDRAVRVSKGMIGDHA